MANELILRDTLAIDRTRLANQRTLLSFIRIGLYFTITGIGIFQFSATKNYFFAAYILIGLGIVLAIIGIINFFRMKKKINKVYQ